MAVRNATAEWKGTLKEGNGVMKLGSGAFEGPYTFVSRFEEGDGTNPEELIGAAQAGCFSMFLSALLTKGGFTATTIQTSAEVHLGQVDGGPAITTINLTTEAVVPDLDDETFQKEVTAAKQNCPVSKALAGVEINVVATLL
jgi:lipoyl-dependent peroxiredoxin